MEQPLPAPEPSAVTTSNVRICSLFNVKEYNSIINQNNIRISKLMKLNINNTQPIALQNVPLNNFADENVITDESTSPKMRLITKDESVVDPSDIPVSSGFPLLPSTSASNIPDVKYCSFCNASFRDQLEQRQHYKLDWHRYNIKLKIKQKQFVTEQQFTQLMTYNDNIDNDDVSSISGSESDDSSDSDKECSPRRLLNFQTQTGDSSTTVMSSSKNRTRVIFENDKGNIVAFYKCLFISNNKADESEPLTESQYINVLKKMPITLPNTKSLVVMLGGGHFAAAVYKGSEPILHKTFHSYTVRAKQGGSQSTKDNKRATGSKSAGASLRRYNEQSLLQHVQDILSSWSSEIMDCKYIFYRAVGPGNRSVLFGGRQPPLDKNDSRLSKIPFPTRRATFSEVKRVYSLLMSLYVYESEEIFSEVFQIYKQKLNDILSSSPSRRKKDKDIGTSTNKTNRASKQRQSPTKDNYDKKISDIVGRLKLESSSDSDNDHEINSKNIYTDSVSDVNISFSESLQEYDNTPLPKKKSEARNKNLNTEADMTNAGDRTTEYVDDSASGEFGDGSKSKKKKKKKKKDDRQLNVCSGNKDPLVNKFAKKIYLACFNGDIDLLRREMEDFINCQKALKTDKEMNQDTESKSLCTDMNDIAFVFNQLTQEGLTMLQNAAKNAQKDIVRFLLENGGDPCARDKKSMTAYDFAPDKETRNVFRRFMGEFPDKYDYSKSHIPSPLSDSIEKEMADRKRALKKAKKQKEKERRIADEPRRQEEAEKKRFLELSDREKRALAAERRILAAVGKAADNLALVRCYQCALNITGKVPFEYDNKRFCSMDCLKANRVINKTNQL